MSSPAHKTVEKIKDAIRRSANAVTLAGLAAEYANLCRKINNRLELTDSVIERGDDYQAIELAETRPPLLEEANILCFSELNQWVEYCESNQLEIPPKLNNGAVQRLNKIYNKGITSNHRLYKEFRDSVLSKNDQSALDAVRKIVRLNPQDQNATAELHRLENKLFLQIERNLTEAIGNNDDGRIVDLLARIEEFEPEKCASSQPVQTAIAIRKKILGRQAMTEVSSIIGELPNFINSDQWLKAGESVSRIDNLVEDHTLALSSDDNALITRARAFFTKNREEAMRRAEFQGAVKDLETLTLSAENLSQVRGTINLGEGRATLLALNRQWQIVEGYTLPVDSELVNRVSRVANFLKQEITRLLKKKRIFWGASVTTVAIVLIASAYFLLQFLRAADTEQQLKKGVSERSVIVVEKLVQATREKYTNLAAMPSLYAAIQKAEDWTKSERGNEKHAIESIDNVISSLSENIAPDIVYSNWQKAKSLFDALPKDLQGSQTDLISKATDTLANWFESQSAKAETDISAQLTEAEREILPKLALSQSAEKVSEALDQANKLLNHWKLYTSSDIPQLSVSPTTQDRIKSVQYAANSAQEALAEYNRLTKQLQDAKTFEDYSSALLSLKSAMLVGSPLVEAAALASVTRRDPNEIAGELLLPDEPLAWAAAQKGEDGLQLKPAKMVQAEIRNITSIRNGDKAKDIYTASVEGRHPRSLYSYPSPLQMTSDNTSAYGGGGKTWTGSVYDPIDGKSIVFFMSATYGTTEDGNYRVNNITNIGKSPFFEAFNNMRLDAFVASDGSILRPVTSVIDDLLQTSPQDQTYTAYVLNALAEMTKLRPNAWGLQFSPECKALLDQINAQLSEDHINPGDWMLTKRRDAIASKVGDLLRAVPPISFAKEAKLRQQLTAAIAKTGLTFAGHVGEGGKPVLLNPYDPPSALWGLSGKASDAKPALLFLRRPQSDPPEYISVNKGQLLVPLFTIPGNPTKLCEDALKSAGIQKQDAEKYLPPMFQGLFLQQP